MSAVLAEIFRQANAALQQPDFLSRLFNENLSEATSGHPIVLFGAGALGREMQVSLANQGIQINAFCDNYSQSKSICNHPVINTETLKQKLPDAIIILTARKFADQILTSLYKDGFNPGRICCKPGDPMTPFLYMYAMVGTQTVLNGFSGINKSIDPHELISVNESSITKVHNLLNDDQSRQLLVSKLAIFASHGHFHAFKEFISNFSQPLKDFGPFGYEGTPEDYYYYNNDVFTLSDGEILADVGAYDGDTVDTFIQSCDRQNVTYSHIHAFEPDPICYSVLEKNVKDIKRVSCHRLGLWSHADTLSFTPSDESIHDQAGSINSVGRVEIQVVSLDEFMPDTPITFIKMDPSGNIIPQVLNGSKNTIRKWNPKLALGAYHIMESIFEIPKIVHSINQDYRLYLRHNTYHLCDTDLYATI